MPTTAGHRNLVAIATATIALAVPLSFGVAPGRSATTADATAPAMFDTKTHFSHSCAKAPRYGWPVKPFRTAHAVRG